jgi:hypothetical protein
MNPLTNPFSPGAGSPPPELAGRDSILDKTKITLGRIQTGRPEKSFLLVGLRGVGKTVLLNRVREIAEEMSYKTIFLEAHENKSLAGILLPSLRGLLFDLDRMENLSEKVKKGFRVLKSFLSGIKLKAYDFELSLDVDPETGTADSGDLEIDLPPLLEAIAEAAKDKKVAIVIIIDELQYLSAKELSALIMSIHRINQRSLPLVLIGAGLPQLVGLAGKSKSYAERLFDYPAIGPLDKKDAIEALQGPLKEQQVEFSREALDEIIDKTKGYPYFLQEWGYHAWNIADKSPITIDVAIKATTKSIDRMDESFFRVRFDRLTPSEKKYLRALADLNAESHRSGDVAEKLGVTVQTLAPTRNSLIKKGMIYSPSHGTTEFTVPLFSEFMKRIMPKNL